MTRLIPDLLIGLSASALFFALFSLYRSIRSLLIWDVPASIRCAIKTHFEDIQRREAAINPDQNSAQREERLMNEFERLRREARQEAALLISQGISQSRQEQKLSDLQSQSAVASGFQEDKGTPVHGSEASGRPKPLQTSAVNIVERDEQTCSNCGTKNDSDAVFCKKCGTKVVNGVEP